LEPLAVRLHGAGEHAERVLRKEPYASLRERQRDRSPVATCFRANGSHGTVGGVLGVEDEFGGGEQFAIGMERSGGRRSLLRGEGLSDAEPREGGANGGHRGAESLGGGAFELGRRIVCRWG